MESDIIFMTYNIADVLSRQGKYEEAERMHRQALALRERVLGKEHPDTLTSMNNLASVLSRQGKYETEYSEMAGKYQNRWPCISQSNKRNCCPAITINPPQSKYVHCHTWTSDSKVK